MQLCSRSFTVILKRRLQSEDFSFCHMLVDSSPLSSCLLVSYSACIASGRDWDESRGGQERNRECVTWEMREKIDKESQPWLWLFYNSVLVAPVCLLREKKSKFPRNVWGQFTYASTTSWDIGLCCASLKYRNGLNGNISITTSSHSPKYANSFDFSIDWLNEKRTQMSNSFLMLSRKLSSKESGIS